MTLRTSSPDQEGLFQASKYLKYQVLVSKEELSSLFQKLAPFDLYKLTGLSDGEPLSSSLFLEVYGSLIEDLQKGVLPEDQKIKTILASALSLEKDAFWVQKVKEYYLIKVCKPVVQVQAHFFSYSKQDGVFHSMTFGSETIFWGLQFSFAQVYQDPKSLEILEAKYTPNWELFQKIKHWVREETRATPFRIDGKRVNATFRLGKGCFSWIHAHPGLRELKVDGT